MRGGAAVGRRALGIGAWLVLWLLAGGAGAGEAAPAAKALDPTSLRNAVGPAVCSVTVENKWGVPVAVSTGFLLGDGRFLVTDLGAVAQPGVDRAAIVFSDGVTATARQFGMADPALGLVALRVDSEKPLRAGLALAPAMPALDGTASVATAGWRWGKQLDLVTGRVWKGPAIKDVASRVHVETPAGVDAFLRIDGGRLEGASGAPVVDTAGTVLAVRLDVAARDITVALAMPAVTLRQSLLSAAPDLKPLAQLAKPLWPVHLLRLRGEPATAAEFARAGQAAKAAMLCKNCDGKGKVDPSKDASWAGRLARALDRYRDFPCPFCRGEGLSPQPEMYAALATWAEQGTRLIWAPLADDRSRAMARTGGLEILKSLASAGSHFRRAFVWGNAMDVRRPDAPMPRGTVLYAEVQEAIDGPDGRYLIVGIGRGTASVAVRADDLAALAGKGAAARREPAQGSWIVLAGEVLSAFDAGKYRGVFVLPFDWVPTTPYPAGPPAPPTR